MIRCEFPPNTTSSMYVSDTVSRAVVVRARLSWEAEGCQLSTAWQELPIPLCRAT